MTIDVNGDRYVTKNIPPICTDDRGFAQYQFDVNLRPMPEKRVNEIVISWYPYKGSNTCKTVTYYLGISDD